VPESCLQTCMTYAIAECTVNKLLMTKELSEICRVSCQNKFVKSVHLVVLIIKKLLEEVCENKKNLSEENRSSNRGLNPGFP
jgi:hypothetical protein